VPDLPLVARTVLQDWNGGKIPYYTEPPQEARMLDAAVVAGYSAEFR
jgi:nuclear GTP-binding protein